ncbi:outer membrane protein [Vibrio nitrifigilis]|uniref:Porin family protein n=1 Tax=Vibrio nitrifigilis TaxID=2789781 RepID=A0ABS0GJ68_9VIBR|nr:outer membrane beta-barrel protein [Vibrio nitrifigilis]MBF9002481.1 porin family protein [Vibrio nitrifigilis]
MNKKTQVCIAAICSLYFTNIEAKDYGYYGSLGIGSSYAKFHDVEGYSSLTAHTRTDDDDDNALITTLGLGYKWQDLPYRVELMYRMVDSEKFRDLTVWDSGYSESTTTTIKQQSLMINGLYDVELEGSDFTPYIGIGIGVTRVTSKGYQYDMTNESREAQFDKKIRTKLTGAFMLGTKYDVSDAFKIGIGYQFSYLGKIGTADNCNGASSLCDGDETHTAKLMTHDFTIQTYYYFN